MYRIVSIATVVLGTAMLLPSAASGQTRAIVRVTQATAVMETPRGDSLVVGSVPSGVVLEVLEARADWYLVTPAADNPTPVRWSRGWIRASLVEVLTPGATTSREAIPTTTSRPPDPSDPLLIRGFGQAGGTFFTARDSFETILGSALGGVYGGGAQVAFGSGLFAQVDVDRFRKTGSRALVSGEQIFRLGIPHVITVTPIEATVGYRSPSAQRTIPYVGGGIGWHAFEETSPDPQGTGDVSDTAIGYHVLGGAEYRIAGWMWLAVEVQWTAVPNAIGEHGVSAVFEEKDLGGASFRFKLLLGR